MTLRRCSMICLILILGLQFIIPGPVQADEELDELQRVYSEIMAEYKGAQDVISNPESTDDEMGAAKDTVGRLGPILDQLSKEIKTKGGAVAEPNRLKTRPGSEVTARHKARDAEGSVTKSVESPCDSYPDLKLPNTSLYLLPPMNQQSGAKRRAAEVLLNAERELAEHLVKCEAEWTYRTAIEWDSIRSALAYRIILLEEEYVWTFSTSNYSKEENDLIAEAYKNNPKIKTLMQEEAKLYAEYNKWKTAADKNTAKFKLAADTATRLNLMNTIEKAKEARTAWRNKANVITQLKGPGVDVLRRARAARAQRGFREMMKYHPSVRFEFHTEKDLTSSNSQEVKKLLGPEGMRILQDEGRRRYDAMMARRQ